MSPDDSARRPHGRGSRPRDVNPALTRADVDITTWTVYPVHGQELTERGPLGFRLGDSAMLGFMHDFARSLNGSSRIMELQPGQVNWGNTNPQPLPGAIRMWLMHSFGSGAKLICSYRYRQPRAGSELYHYGFVGPDGVTPLPGGLEFAQAMHEINQLRKLRKPNAAMPARYAARRTGLLYNYDNRYDLDNQRVHVPVGHHETHVAVLQGDENHEHPGRCHHRRP